MKEYHKIQSLFKRDPDTKFKTFLEGQYTLDEFEYLSSSTWRFEEKVDGTNVRVHWDAGSAMTRYGGRTDNAQMPVSLVNRLDEIFTEGKLAGVFPEGEFTLYGEGYGAKIQKGGGDYIPDGQGFILFDVNCQGVWLERLAVYDIAAKLGIPHCPVIGSGDLEEAVEMCWGGFESKLRNSAPEGLVLRPGVELLTRRGERIITKLKLRDFRD